VFAVASLLGAFMASDQITVALVEGYVNKIEVDVGGSIYPDNFNSFVGLAQNLGLLRQSILNIEHVLSADFFTVFRVDSEDPPQISKVNSSRILTVLSIACIAVNVSLEGIDVNGSLRGGVGIGYELAKELDADVGDVVQICFQNKTFNLSLAAIVRFDGEFLDAYKWIVLDGVEDIINPRYGLISAEDTLREDLDPNYALVVSMVSNGSDDEEPSKIWIREVLSNIALGGKTYLMIRLNRTMLINPYDLGATKSVLLNILNKIRYSIRNTIPGISYYLESYIGEVISFLETKLKEHRIKYLMMVAPILALALILAIVSNIGLVQRSIKEIGLLMIRGMSSKQVAQIFIAESIMVGIISGGIGFGLSYLISIFTLTSIAHTSTRSFSLIESMASAIGDYLLQAFLLGISLSFISILYPLRKALKLNLSDVISNKALDMEDTIIIRKTLVILILISLFEVVDLVLGMPIFRLLRRGIMGGNYFLGLFMLICIIIYIITFVGAPFVLILGLSKLLTKLLDKFSKAFRVFIRPLSRDLDGYVISQLTKRKMRFCKTILLLTITLIFAIYFTISSAMVSHRIKIDTRIAIGSDLKIIFNDVQTYDSISRINEVIGNVSGVDSWAVISILNRHVKTIALERIYVLDPRYVDVSFIDDSSLYGLSLDAFRKALSDPRKVVLPYYYRDLAGYEIGSEVYVRIFDGNEIRLYNFTVAGYIKWAPGLSGIDDLQTHGNIFFVGSSVFSRLPMFSTQYADILGVLIRVKQAKNSLCIGKSLLSMFASRNIGVQIYVYEKALKDAMADPLILYDDALMGATFVGSMLMVIISIVLIGTTNTLSRQSEIALLRARGASLRNILNIVLGEMIIIVVLSFAVGICIALLFTYSYTLFVFGFLYIIVGGFVEFPQDYIMMIPREMPATITILFVLLLSSAIISTILLYRRDLSKALRVAI